MNVRQIVHILAIFIVIATCVMPVVAEEERDPATLYYNLAQESIATGDLEGALNYFEMVLAANTTLLGLGDGLMYTYKDRAALLTDLGRYEEAIAASDEGIALFPKEPGLWNNKGWAYFKMGRYSDAAGAYDKAVTLDPEYLKGWINKGDALTKAGRAGEAVDAYKKALALDPGNKDAEAGLAEAEKSAMTTNIILVVILIIAAGLVVWYVKFRKPEETKPANKGGQKK